MLELLQSNKGFSYPEKWIDYGIRHDFKIVHSDKLETCPDCRATSWNSLGQFIYYSTLVNLQFCAGCGLVFSDTRIDPRVIQAHFEREYKDETYFLHQRRSIFEQISQLVEMTAPQGGRVLDVGGAKGHLLALLKERRMDLSLVLNDLSEEACAFATSRYGLETLWGDINSLDQLSSPFDAVIMSDVIYYEPQLDKLWSILPRLVAREGMVIIRVPNKLPLIRFWQLFMNKIRRKDLSMQTRIRFFNPEHLYVFSQQYLLTRLKRIGFTEVMTLPSELLQQGRGSYRPSLYYSFSKVVSALSNGKLIITPSILVIAKKKVGE